MCDTLFRQTNAVHFCIDLSVQLDQSNVIPINIGGVVLGVFDLAEGLALTKISVVVIDVDLRFPTEQGEKINYLRKKLMSFLTRDIRQPSAPTGQR